MKTENTKLLNKVIFKLNEDFRTFFENSIDKEGSFGYNIFCFRMNTRRKWAFSVPATLIFSKEVQL